MSETILFDIMPSAYLTIFDDILRFVTSGQIGGVPTFVAMLFPFILGIVIGFLLKKTLKIAIILGIIVVIAAYFGLFNLSLSSLKDAAIRYGPNVAHYATIVIGMLPLGLGLIVGVVIGFLI